MSAVGNLNIKFGVDTVEFQASLNLTGAQAEKFAKKLQANFDNAKLKAQQFSAKTSSYLNNIDAAMSNLNNSARLTVWTNIFSSMGGSLGSLGKHAEMYQEIANKLRLVEPAGINASKGLQSIFDISLKTNQSVDATSSVYQRFAQNAQTLGISQAQVASLTETVSKAVAISGASAAASQAALTQFGQSLASGVFRGEEFNSVMEQTPGLAQAIATGLGVSTDELRNMAKQGQLTMDVLIPALEKAKDSVDAQFATRVVTVSGAFENLNTATIKWAGELDQTLGLSQKFVGVIGGVSEHLNAIGGAVGVGTLGAIANQFKSFVKTGNEQAVMAVAAAEAEKVRTQALREQAATEMNLLQIKASHARTDAERLAVISQLSAAENKLTAAINAEAAAQRNLAIAQKQTNALSRLGASALSFVGGPIGAVSIALAAGAGFWLDYSQKTAEAHNKALAFANDLPKLTAEIEKMNSIQLGAEKAKAEESIIAQQQEIDKLSRKITDLQKKIAETPKIDVTLPDDFGVEVTLDNTNRLARLSRELAKAKAELEERQSKLNDTQNVGEQISAQLSARTEEMIGFVERYSDLTLTSENRINTWAESASSAISDFDGLTVSVNGLSGALAKLSGMSISIPSADKVAPQLSDAAKQLIDKSKRQAAISKEKDPNKKAKLRAEDYVLSLDKSKFSEYDIAQIQAQKEAEYLANALSQSGSKKSGRKKSKNSGENARDNWLSFYDEIRQKSSSSLGEIDLEEQRMFQRLEEHMKKGVVSHTEYETAKLSISERFAKERLELAGKYAPEKLLSSNLKDELSAIEELRKAGQLTDGEAQTAEYQLKFDYAQSKAQSAVDPLDQMRALYDPRQELANQQAEELAQLQGFYDQKLMNEEEFQRRKKEIIDTYRNQQFQEDMEQYATGLNDLGSAFGVLASSVEASAGKQSAAYKAMFAISKAFAIAEATVKLSQAVAQAMAAPDSLTPAQKFANMASVAAAGANVISQITSVAFAKGGHVVGEGTGTSDSILARLSNNEFVMTSRTVDHYGVDFLNALNQRRFPKFANGGHVSGSSPSYAGLFNGGRNNISVKVINNGEPTQADVSTKRNGNELEITIELMRQIAKSEANNAIQNNFRAGGAFA